MSDQFRHLRPGEKLAGLYTRPWNKFLDAILPDMSDRLDTGGKGTTSVEVDVLNTTANAVNAFGILGIAGPLNAYDHDPSGYVQEDVFKGVAPSPGAAFGILQDGVAPNGLAPARLLGRASCKVNLTDTAHRYAVPITTPSPSTAELTSASTGPVRLLATESNFATTGSQWAVVLLLGQAAGGGGSRFIRFTLTAALAVTTASVAGCTVNDYWGSPDPGSTVTVWNLPASANYIFAGANGAKGLATFDDIDSKWWIVQMECGSSAGGGVTGFTGTIGD